VEADTLGQGRDAGFRTTLDRAQKRELGDQQSRRRKRVVVELRDRPGRATERGAGAGAGVESRDSRHGRVYTRNAGHKKDRAAWVAAARPRRGKNYSAACG